MKQINLLLLIALSVFFAACNGNCPPDEKVGDIELHSDTQTWIPYDGTEVLTFANQDSVSFSVGAPDGKMEGTDKVCTKRICIESDFNGTSTCEFFASEFNRFVFSNNTDFVCDVLYFSEVVRPETQEFYQSLRVSVSFGETLFGGGQIITKTIPEQVVDPLDVGFNEVFEEINSVELNGVTYENVLKGVNTSMTIYFSQSQGLVGFETATDTWNLE